MTAGIPGAGIAGLFYLASAFVMPFKEAHRAAHGQSTPRSRRLVARLFLIAVGMFATIWSTALLLEHTIKFVVPATTPLPPLLTYSAFLLSSATLAAILVGVQAMRWAVALRPELLEVPVAIATTPASVDAHSGAEAVPDPAS